MNKVSNCGFTLIEIIAAVMLLGIVAVATTLGFTRSVEEFAFTKDNAALAQKAQVALNRILIELSYFDKADANAAHGTFSPTVLKYPSKASDATAPLTFSLNGTKLQWQGLDLCDNVQSLVFTYDPAAPANPSALKSVHVVLTLIGNNNVAKTFDYTMAIKNLYSGS